METLGLPLLPDLRLQREKKTYPVIEVFGPVIQGEGPMAGTATNFVRFGGCDYRCSWCDSLYAVLPDQVRANARKLKTSEIIDELRNVGMEDGDWITLSGGNPAMLDLQLLVDELHRNHCAVAVETQGTFWKPWMRDVDSLVVSPKGPSSGMVEKTHADLPDFMDAAEASGMHPEAERDGIKIVIFNDDDFEWAIEVMSAHTKWRSFMSAGTTPPVEGEDRLMTLEGVADRYAWLCEKVAHSQDCTNLEVRVLPQLHVIAFGHARGV